MSWGGEEKEWQEKGIRSLSLPPQKESWNSIRISSSVYVHFGIWEGLLWVAPSCEKFGEKVGSEWVKIGCPCSHLESMRGIWLCLSLGSG